MKSNSQRLWMLSSSTFWTIIIVSKFRNFAPVIELDNYLHTVGNFAVWLILLLMAVCLGIIFTYLCTIFIVGPVVYIAKKMFKPISGNNKVTIVDEES